MKLADLYRTKLCKMLYQLALVPLPPAWFGWSLEVFNIRLVSPLNYEENVLCTILFTNPMGKLSCCLPFNVHFKAGIPLVIRRAYVSSVSF